MINALNFKVVQLTPPGAIVDDAGFTTAILDTLGVGWVTFLVALGATDIALAAFKLQESDDSGMSGAADVPNGDFSVAPATLPGADDDDNLFAIHVNTLGRMRYLDLVLTAGDGSTGTYADVKAILSRMQTTPSTATDRGFTQELFAG